MSGIVPFKRVVIVCAKGLLGGPMEGRGPQHLHETWQEGATHCIQAFCEKETSGTLFHTLPHMPFHETQERRRHLEYCLLTRAACQGRQMRGLVFSRNAFSCTHLSRKSTHTRTLSPFLSAGWNKEEEEEGRHYLAL